MKEIIYKSISGRLKDLDVKGRTVTGYFSAFGSLDSDNDIIMPGAFSKSIQENGPSGSNRIQFLWQHDPHMPLGKPSVLKEDDYGLYFEAKIAPTSWGENAIKLYDAGVINEHSIGFQTLKNIQRADHNEINEVKLWEGSAVTFGANQYTPFLGMKSIIMTKDQFIEKTDKLMKGIKAGTFVGENEYLLDLAFNQLKSEFLNVFDRVSPVQATPDPNNPLDPLKHLNQATDVLDPIAIMKALEELNKLIS